MKIEGPRGPSQTRYTSKIGRSSSAGGASKPSFMEMGGTADVASAATTSGVAGIGAIDQLLGLQEIDDALGQRRNARQRGTEILDRLDELRLQILEGRISASRLIQLAQVVQRQRASVTDPKLVEVLDEIDLRAQVEIAKFMRDQGA
jgi:hypothetical protein